MLRACSTDGTLRPTDLAAAPSGDFAAAGIYSAWEDIHGVWTARFSSEGEPRWSTFLRSSGDYILFETVLVAAGDETTFVAMDAIHHDSAGSLELDAFLLAYDQVGRERWRKLFRTPGSAGGYPAAVLALPDGGVVVVTGTFVEGSGEPSGDVCLTRWSEDGTLEWSRVLAADGAVLRTTPAAIAEGGRLFVAGTAVRSGEEPTTIWTAELDGDGGLVRRHAVRGVEPERVAGLVVDADGRLVVSTGDGLAALDGEGSVVWRSSYGGSRPARDVNGEFVFGGASGRGPEGESGWPTMVRLGTDGRPRSC